MVFSTKHYADPFHFLRIWSLIMCYYPKVIIECKLSVADKSEEIRMKNSAGSAGNQPNSSWSIYSRDSKFSNSKFRFCYLNQYNTC